MNETVYIVTYELRPPAQRYDELQTLIKSEGKWARLGQSSYLVISNKTAVQLRDKFKTVLDGNDNIFVGKVIAPAAWAGMPDKVTEWIIKALQ